MSEEQGPRELHIEYFDGAANITQGSRDGEDLILAEILMNFEEDIESKQTNYSGTVAPNTNVDLDNVEVGSLYILLDGSGNALEYWRKYRVGSNGWDLISLADQIHGTLYISDITTSFPGASVSNKVYANPPTDSVLISCTSSSTSIDIDIVSSYPHAKVFTSQGDYEDIDLTPNGLMFTGTITATVNNTSETIVIKTITPNGYEAANQLVDITIVLPPELVTLRFNGTYPGSQTEYKENDTVNIIGTTDVPCSGIEILTPTGIYSDGACKGEVINFAPTTSINVTATIENQGNVLTSRPVYVRAKNADGAYGSVRASNFGGGTTDHEHLVNCNNIYPSISIGTVTYPVTQGALKNSESATIVNTLSNYNNIQYSSPNGDLSITSPTTYQSPKTVTRISGTYNDSINNFQITATRTANDAVTTQLAIVEIAHVAPSIAVTEPASRLRSGGNDGSSAQNHTITITSNQKLITAPTLNPAPSAGTFIGSWSGGSKVWTRSLQVHDDDTKGTHSWSGLVATNKANIIQNTISGDSNYVLGGFVARDVYFTPAVATGTINVAVTTYSKLSATAWSLKDPETHPPLLNPVQGNHSNIVDTYTVDSIGTNPTTVYCNDQVLVGQNTLGMYLEELEESV